MLASRLSGAFPPVAYDLALRTAFGQNQEEDRIGVGRMDVRSGRLFAHVSSIGWPCCTIMSVVVLMEDWKLTPSQIVPYLGIFL